MVFCISCGTELLGGARYCNGCGREFSHPNTSVQDENSSQSKEKLRLVKMKYDNEQRIREEERERRAEEEDFATLHGVGEDVARRRAKYKDVTQIKKSYHVDSSTNISQVQGPVFSNVGSVGTVVSGNMHVGLDERAVGLEVGRQIDSLKEDPRDVFKKGTSAFFHGDYANAIALFERALQLDPDAFQPRRFLALSYMADQKLKYMTSDDIQQAENYLLQCLRQKKDDVLSLILLAALKYDYYMVNSYRQGEPRFSEIEANLKERYLPEKDFRLLKMVDLSKTLKNKLNIVNGEKLDRKSRFSA